MRNVMTVGVVAALAALAAAPAQAQTSPETDPLVEALHDGNTYIRGMFTTAAEQMSEGDYAFKPTPEVRSFGQLLAHVADTNYYFCSAAAGETAPVSGVEGTTTAQGDIREVLADSFDYCDTVFATASRNADRTVELMGTQRSPMAVLNFRNYHALLHYGNVVTYMRLRGRVPPSSQLTESH